MMESKYLVKPIHTKEDYLATMSAIESLLDCKPGSRDADLLEVLSILADEYENKNMPIEAPDPIEAVKYKMEQMNLSQKDVAQYFGGENRASEVLNRKRPLTLKMIKSLHKELQIPANVLLAG